ncbi:hypothetical protein BJ508DRAFT_366020 [Ascobolus immersus RN42]|uniref:DUF7918 domain-containing protein n=1 Tax=Ascobolus immersus RN42 TaxID=1160509 RepID=A0A3N4HYT5_ASCIM|nr:hypothetical protein BJ508DRAFT_366020 [Ascobolus immersus RN42]
MESGHESFQRRITLRTARSVPRFLSFTTLPIARHCSSTLRRKATQLTTPKVDTFDITRRRHCKRLSPQPLLKSINSTMVSFNGLEFTVTTRSGPLREHAFPNEEPENTRTVFVEVPERKTPVPFKIKVIPVAPLVFRDRFIGYDLTLKADGIEDAYTMPIANYRNATRGFTYDGIFISTPDRTAAIKKEMRFQKVQTSEFSSEEVDAGVIGKITIEIRNLEARIPLETPPLRNEQQSIPTGPINEANLKGSSASHLLSTGKNMGFSGPDPFELVRSSVFSTLRILYRSRKALQSLGVIRLDPIPVHLKKRKRVEVDLTIKADDGTYIKPEPDWDREGTLDPEGEFEEEPILPAPKPKRRAYGWETEI